MLVQQVVQQQVLQLLCVIAQELIGVQPAITAANWNYDTKPCPPGFSSTWTNPNATTTCKVKRQGGDAFFDVVVSMSGAPSGGNYAFNLPTGWTIDTARTNPKYF